jgi:hypothetical protein
LTCVGHPVGGDLTLALSSGAGEGTAHSPEEQSFF